MRGRRSADGDPEVTSHIRETYRDAAGRCLPSGRPPASIRESVPSASFDTQTVRAHDGDPVRAVPDLDRIRDQVRLRVDLA